MNKRAVILFLTSIALSVSCFAQKEKMTREDKDEIQQEKKLRAKEKVDYNLFRRQMLALKEYADERKKIPALQKAAKMTVKIVVAVDSTDGGDDSKVIMGYIREDIGDNSTNIYEITFDRSSKKIVLIKPTGESNDLEKDDEASEKKVKSKTIIHKKAKSDDDDDDDIDEEKTPKKHKKDTDDE